MGSGASRYMADRRLKDHSKLCETTWRESNDGKGNLRDQMRQIHNSLHSFDKMPFKERQEYRTKAGDELVEKNCLRIICQHLSESLSSKKGSNDLHKVLKLQKNGKQDENEDKSVVELAMEAVVLVTDPDCSAKACEEVFDHPSFLDALLSRLTTIAEKTKLSFDEEIIFREGLSILHNLAVYLSECTDAYEASADIFTKIPENYLDRMVKVFKHFLEADDKQTKLLSVTALACIKEEMVEYVHTQFMCLNLSLAFDEADHRCLRCSVTAMERGVRHLLKMRTIEDENKKEIDFTKNLVQCGVLRLMTKGVKSEVRQERKACLECLWTLCCSTKECRKDLAEDEMFLDLLMKLYDDLSDRIFQELAELMLVNLYRSHDLNLKKQPRHLRYGQDGKGVKVDKQGERKGIGHVMISYQWESKSIIQEIKQYLEDHNIKVWIDDDKMNDEADINDAMAHAVENAAIFLMGVSAKYGASKNCKKEANYAEVTDIPIIPLMLQKRFKPSGWLGIITGNKLYYDFSDPKDGGTKSRELKNLLKKIEGELKKAGVEDGSSGESNQEEQKNAKKGPQLTRVQPAAAKSPRELLWVSPYCRLNPHAACTSRQDGFSHCCCVATDPRKEVKEWAKKHKLEGAEVKALSKKDIETLLHLREKSREFFYKRVWKDLKMRKISDVMQFEAALNNWKKEQDKKTEEKKEKSNDELNDGPKDKKNEENKENKNEEE